MQGIVVGSCATHRLERAKERLLLDMHKQKCAPRPPPFPGSTLSWVASPSLQTQAVAAEFFCLSGTAAACACIACGRTQLGWNAVEELHPRSTAVASLLPPKLPSTMGRTSPRSLRTRHCRRGARLLVSFVPWARRMTFAKTAGAPNNGNGQSLLSPQR